MKRTPLYNEHIKLGAKIIEFNNWQMPVQYTNIIDEHMTTRNKACIFDTSHMGEFLIEGKDSFKFLQRILAKDINKLENGKCSYTVMCNENSGIIDDLLVYRFNNRRFMLVVNAGTIEKDFRHLISNKENFDVEIKNASNEIAKLDIQGRKAERILQKLTQANLNELKRFGFKEILLNEIKILISRSGYTGEDGFELYFNKEKAVEMWNKILEAGKEHGLKPAGLGARNTLRLESCYSLYSHELNENISPIEAGIPFTVSFDKEFIGKKALEKVKATQKRIIAAFEMLEKGIPRQNYKIVKNNKEIGYVTSGTMSPTLKKGIGLALIEIGYSQPETEIDINIRDKLYRAKIVKKPFYRGV